MAFFCMPLMGFSQTSLSIYAPDFSSSAGWQLNQNAITTGTPGYLRLTPNAFNQAGSAFWKKKIALSADYSFSLYFTFKMTPGTRADGITFCIQQADNTAGGSGGGIGYEGIPGKSVAIEYDTYLNIPDPNNNHIAFNQNGIIHNANNYPYINTLPYVQSSLGLDLADGELKYNWIEYNGVAKTLEVRIAKNATRPDLPALMISNIDLSSILANPDVFFGFTAATGGLTEEHAIYTVYAINSYQPFPSNPQPVDFIQGIANIDLLASNDITCVNETSQITIKASDKNNNPLPGRSLNLSIDEGTASLSAMSVITDANGQAFVTLDWVNSESVRVRAYDPVAGAYGTVLVNASSNWTEAVADFEVLNEGELCSNRQVMFRNRSKTIGLGSISKLEWYLDYLNQPTQRIVDDHPSADKVYSFTYPDFNSPAGENYTVRLLAYAAGSCVISEKIKTINIKSASKVVFDDLPEVCVETSPFQITQARETRGTVGSYKFSGPGVSEYGWFNPKIAGIGTHTIKYVFSGTNACPDSLSREIKVYASPSVNVGRDTTLIIGQKLQLNAQVTANHPVYLWSPAVGLDRYDIPNPVLSANSNMTYTLTVTADGNCSTSDQINIKVLELPVVPNAFTPNGDGVNDVWNIKNLKNFEQASLQVFNRYGKLVFQTIGYPAPWEGKFNGIDMPMATYYYIINLGFGLQPIAGSVTLIR